jgi:2,4-dienoyl-CoA reductase-like NADH-dependent reductase (Old Yellow Enzyme family)
MSVATVNLAAAFRANRIAAIAELPTNTAASAEAAYAEIVALVIVMNAEIHQDQSRGTGSEGNISDELLAHLKPWISELRKKLAAIAKQLKFQSCSIAVIGPVPSVSVTVTFGPATG